MSRAASEAHYCRLRSDVLSRSTKKLQPVNTKNGIRESVIKHGVLFIQEGKSKHPSHRNCNVSKLSKSKQVLVKLTPSKVSLRLYSLKDCSSTAMHTTSTKRKFVACMDGTSQLYHSKNWENRRASHSSCWLKPDLEFKERKADSFLPVALD